MCQRASVYLGTEAKDEHGQPFQGRHIVVNDLGQCREAALLVDGDGEVVVQHLAAGFQHLAAVLGNFLFWSVLFRPACLLAVKGEHSQIRERRRSGYFDGAEVEFSWMLITVLDWHGLSWILMDPHGSCR